MGVHPDGSGTSWADLEAVDVDQPHGLDYRYSTHIAIAVRKRLNKEHKSFADSTAGGEHKPGGCAILDIVDASTDISIDDSTYKGRNLVYDQANFGFWCFTNTDGTASTPDAYKLKIGPKSICLGGDFTWDGAHLFDASVDMSDVAITGDLTIAGKLAVDGSADFSDVVITGDLSTAGTISHAGDVTITGALNVDSSFSVRGETDLSVTSIKDFTGDAKQRVCSAWAYWDGTKDGSILGSYNVSDVSRNATGKYTVYFTDNMPNANYAAIAQGRHNSGGDKFSDYIYCSSQAIGSVGVTVFSDPNNNYYDLCAMSIIVFGAN